MSRNLGKQGDDQSFSDLTRVRYIEHAPSSCIEVRYHKSRHRCIILSYAIYNASTEIVSHEATTILRKRGTDLSSLLAFEQKDQPDYPIHIV